MPTVLRIDGYRFFFYSNEHLPKHIHVEYGNGVAKFSLDSCELVKAKRLNATDINRIRKLVVENKRLLIAKWDEYFNN